MAKTKAKIYVDGAQDDDQLEPFSSQITKVNKRSLRIEAANGGIQIFEALNNILTNHFKSGKKNGKV